MTLQERKDRMEAAGAAHCKAIERRGVALAKRLLARAAFEAAEEAKERAWKAFVAAQEDAETATRECQELNSLFEDRYAAWAEAVELEKEAA